MVSKLTQFAILLNQIHLGEDIDMRKLHMKHGGQRGAEHRDELGRVSTVMRVHKMHCRQLKEAGNMLEKLVKTEMKKEKCVCIIYVIRPKSVVQFQKLTLKFHLASWENIFFTEF